MSSAPMSYALKLYMTGGDSATDRLVVFMSQLPWLQLVHLLIALINNRGTKDSWLHVAVPWMP